MADLPSIVPSLSVRSPTRYLETSEYRAVYSVWSSRLLPTMATMTGANGLYVGDLSGRGVRVKSRGGRTCRGLPIGRGSEGQA